MRIYADAPKKVPTKFKVPVVEKVPEYGIFEEGELLFCKGEEQGLYVQVDGFWTKVLGEPPVWKMICQEFFVQEQDKQIFDLDKPYKMHADVLNVFVNGKKLSRQSFVEITETQVILKEPVDIDSQVEFQYFQVE